MTLEEAVVEFEQEHDVSPLALVGPRAPNGQLFVTVVCGGIKEEGNRFPVYCTSEDVAAKMWLEAAKEYAPVPSKIFWRARPMMDRRVLHDVESDINVFRPDTFFVVYSRFYAEPRTDGPW